MNYMCWHVGVTYVCFCSKVKFFLNNGLIWDGDSVDIVTDNYMLIDRYTHETDWHMDTQMKMEIRTDKQTHLVEHTNEMVWVMWQLRRVRIKVFITWAPMTSPPTTLHAWHIYTLTCWYRNHYDMTLCQTVAPPKCVQSSREGHLCKRWYSLNHEGI